VALIRSGNREETAIKQGEQIRRRMEEESNLEVFDGLPPQPVSAEAVKSLGESEAVTGTMPIKSEFNDVITEFLVIKEETMHALAFDPDDEKWHRLESREFTQETVHEVEDELMDRLYDWRGERVTPYLVENNLIPNAEI
jgi:hypothetical protein